MFVFSVVPLIVKKAAVLLKFPHLISGSRVKERLWIQGNRCVDVVIVVVKAAYVMELKNSER